MLKIINEILDITKWSGLRLALELGVDECTVSRWVNGHNRPVYTNTKEKIHELYMWVKQLEEYEQEVEYKVEITDPLNGSLITCTACYTITAVGSKHDTPFFKLNIKGYLMTITPEQAFNQYKMKKLKNNQNNT